MNSITTIAGTAGRITGTTVRVAQELNALIDWREALEIAWQGIVVLAVLTYHAGRLTGRTVHKLNNLLATAWRRLLVPTTADTSIEQSQALFKAEARSLNKAADTNTNEHVRTSYEHVGMAPAIHPLAALAAELEQLTCRELQALTGCRRKASKARLVALALTA